LFALTMKWGMSTEELNLQRFKGSAVLNDELEHCIGLMLDQDQVDLP